MGKSKVIAIAFSDLHLNIWSKFNKNNERTLTGFKVLSRIVKECEKYKVPALFCGDLFHKPENIDQDLALLFRDFIRDIHRKHLNFSCYAIEGNHDLKLVNVLDYKDVGKEGIKRGWINLFEDDSSLVVISPKTPPVILKSKYMVHGVPYIDHNTGLNDYLKTLKLEEGFKHILLLHTDYPGAKDTDGRVVDSVENLNMNILNRFDLVLCGHIHKPQRLGKKVYMLGAPIQQRRTDKDCKMGFWKVMSDLSMEFVPLKGFPKFIDVDTPEEVKDDGNYYTVIPQKASEKIVTTHKITKKLSKKKLAHHYMKAKGIKDPEKEDLLTNILKKSEE